MHAINQNQNYFDIFECQPTLSAYTIYHSVNNRFPDRVILNPLQEKLPNNLRIGLLHELPYLIHHENKYVLVAIKNPSMDLTLETKRYSTCLGALFTSVMM